MDRNKARKYMELVAATDSSYGITKLLLTSDIHTSGLEGIVPGDDIEIVVIAGDVMGAGSDSDEAGEKWLRNVFSPWAQELGKRGIDIVLTPGNHDRYLYRRWKAHRSENWPSNVHYLIDAAATVNGIRFYGTPWCENNRTGRFEGSQKECAAAFARIPNGVDILVSHTPPLVAGSKIDVKEDGSIELHCGSASLTEALLEKKPKLCVCGHVHAGDRKPVVVGETMVINVSRVGADRSTEAYCPQVIEFKKSFNKAREN